jgi:GABA(A) receptor-associated protein
MKWAHRTPQQKRDDVLRLLKRYPDKIPVYVEGENISQNKFLVPYDITVAQFLYMLREKVLLTPNESIFVFFGTRKQIMPSNMIIREIYDILKDDDDMLYAFYAKENVFG